MRYLHCLQLAEVQERLVGPICSDVLALSFDAQVEGDVMALFRKGAAFEQVGCAPKTAGLGPLLDP